MKKRRATRVAHTHFWDIFRQSNTYDHDLAEAGDIFDIGVKILKVKAREGKIMNERLKLNGKEYCCWNGT